MAESHVRATPRQLSDALSAVREWNPRYRQLLQMILEEVKLLDPRSRNSTGFRVADRGRRRSSGRSVSQ
jgi:hypothetical protein